MDDNTDNHQNEIGGSRDQMEQWRARMFGEHPQPEPADKHVAVMVNITDDEQPYNDNPYIRLSTVNARRRALGERAGAILWLSEVEHNSN
jgi:hypothetical protein